MIEMGTHEALRAMRALTVIGAILASAVMLLVGPMSIAIATPGPTTCDGCNGSPNPGSIGNLGNSDIGALVFITLMNATNSANQDLQNIMDQIQEQIQAKAALRTLPTGVTEHCRVCGVVSRHS